MVLTVTLIIGASFTVDAAMSELAADVKLAMDRSGLTQDWVARTIGLSESRLSRQLNGLELFSAFCRFGCRDMRETDFWPEFLEIRAKRFDRAIVTSDLGVLVAKVTELVQQRKKTRMVKATLAEPQKAVSA